MGLFSGIKKVVKNVFKGVKKVFSKVTKFVGKIAGSKWGKGLLLAAAVFTGGMALSAGLTGFTSTAGTFMTKFVAGAQQFMGALANPIGQAKTLMGSAGAAAPTVGQAAQAAGAAAEAAAPAEMIGAAAGGAATPIEGLTAAASKAIPGQAAAAMGQGAGAGVGAGAGAGGGGGIGGMLAKGAGAALDFAKSSGGGTLLAGAIGGFAEGKQQEELLKEQERVRRYYDKQWRDPGKLAQLEGAVEGDVNVPGGYLDRARRVSEFLNERDYKYPSSAGDPNAVAARARSPGA